jgi:hypothetical protein
MEWIKRMLTYEIPVYAYFIGWVVVEILKQVVTVTIE